MRTWPASIRGKLTISSCCQRPAVVYAVPKTLVVSGFCGSRVERSRQRDLGIELDAGPIGADPNRGPQFVDDPRPPDVVGNQHHAAALADDLEPFTTLSAVRPAANPLMGDQRVLGVAAGFDPGGRWSFEVLPPRRLPRRNGSTHRDRWRWVSVAHRAAASCGRRNGSTHRDRWRWVSVNRGRWCGESRAGSPCAAERLVSTTKTNSATCETCERDTKPGKKNLAVQCGEKTFPARKRPHCRKVCLYQDLRKSARANVAFFPHPGPGKAAGSISQVLKLQ